MRTLNDKKQLSITTVAVVRYAAVGRTVNTHASKIFYTVQNRNARIIIGSNLFLITFLLTGFLCYEAIEITIWNIGRSVTCEQKQTVQAVLEVTADSEQQLIINSNSCAYINCHSRSYGQASMFDFYITRCCNLIKLDYNII